MVRWFSAPGRSKQPKCFPYHSSAQQRAPVNSEVADQSELATRRSGRWVIIKSFKENRSSIPSLRLSKFFKEAGHCIRNNVHEDKRYLESLKAKLRCRRRHSKRQGQVWQQEARNISHQVQPPVQGDVLIAGNKQRKISGGLLQQKREAAVDIHLETSVGLPDCETPFHKWFLLRRP